MTSQVKCTTILYSMVYDIHVECELKKGHKGIHFNTQLTEKQVIKTLEELGVIKIDAQGNIHRTEFGQQVYDYMRQKKYKRWEWVKS